MGLSPSTPSAIAIIHGAMKQSSKFLTQSWLAQLARLHRQQKEERGNHSQPITVSALWMRRVVRCAPWSNTVMGIRCSRPIKKYLVGYIEATIRQEYRQSWHM